MQEPNVILPKIEQTVANTQSCFTLPFAYYLDDLIFAKYDCFSIFRCRKRFNFLFMKMIKCERCGISLDLSVSKCMGCGARKMLSLTKERIVMFSLLAYTIFVIYWLIPM